MDSPKIEVGTDVDTLNLRYSEYRDALAYCLDAIIPSLSFHTGATWETECAIDNDMAYVIIAADRKVVGFMAEPVNGSPDKAFKELMRRAIPTVNENKHGIERAYFARTNILERLGSQPEEDT